MTPEELTAARHKLGLSVGQFATIVGVQAGRTVRRWEDGSRDIPGPVVILVWLMLNIPEVRKALRVGDPSPG
jgi:DNA-binding transcriptional regulator YiaG